MDKRGSLIIYDLKGTIWFNSGDAAGEGLVSHQTPEGLPYIITEYGELDYKILKGVDVSVEPHKLITEDIITLEMIESQKKKEIEEKQKQLEKENIELENQLLLAEHKNLGGIL